MAFSNGQQKFDVSVVGTIDSVYQSVLSAARSMRTKGISEQAALHMVSFQTKASALTWGQRWMVQVTSGDNGTVNVSATVTAKNGGQQFDQSKIAKLAEEFYQRVAVGAAV